MQYASPASRSAHRRKAAASPRRPWADLPPDLLRDVSARLHDAADSVRFHAVCRPWRRTSPQPLFRVASTPCDGLVLHSTVDSPRRSLWPIMSVASYSRDYVTFARFAGENNWVASSDGTAAWLFTASPEPSLLDLDTREVTPLPRLPEHEITLEYSRGIVYGDGTVFLHSFVNDASGYGRRSTFTAAILRPGDAAWTIVKRKLHVIGNRCTGAAYHDGRVLMFVHVYKYYWCVLTPAEDHHEEENDDDDLEGGLLEPWMHAGLENTYFRDSYVLESHGELLWVTVFVDKKWRRVDDDRDPTFEALSVKVHMLHWSNDDKGSNNARWMPRDGQSLSDRVFFLGSPASFTVDVVDPGGANNGGCVYFVFDRCVLRYSLVDNEAEIVEMLRPGWGSDFEHVWLRQ